MEFKKLTRLEHSFFALPFILSAFFLSMRSSSFQWSGAVWILPCFFLARISGMAFNQWIDADLDAKNPRTQHRVIPSGQVTIKQAQGVAWGALTLFLLLSLRINFLVALLAPIAAGFIFFYSYMKRFHILCHFVLGMIHFLGSLIAYVACCQSISIAIVCLSSASACLIIGTDMIYAIQDYAFDCQHRLFSLPSSFGIKNSLKIALLCHFLSLFFLFGTGYFSHLLPIYYILIPLLGGYFLQFHLCIWKEFRKGENFKNLEKNFFLCNVIVAAATLFCIVIAL